ncbi:MAG: hypothetical protein WC584_02225 [Candidatus Pacearchaeota archaeon]
MKRDLNHLRKVIYTILVAFAIVSFWRGVWGLMDIYLFPKNHPLSLVVSLIVGISILYFTNHLIKHLI